MRKSGVISVIVPVYGVEKYLETCIDSIINQSYTDLEVILVDDGSPDRCGEICDRYARQDSRIVALHQKNAGAAAARNAGLRIATGEYIAFVDSDDYLEPDAYEKLAAALVEHDADIVQGKFRNIYVNGTEIHGGSDETVCFSTAAYLVRFTTDWTCALTPDKLFRHPVLTNVFYEEGHMIDDEFFTYQGVMNARKIVCIPTVVYNYRQRASSVMKNPATAERKTFDTMEFLEKRMDRVVACFPELRACYEGDYIDSLLRLAVSDWATENTVREVKKLLLAFVAGGRVLPWKKGQRKNALRILCFLLKRTDKILKDRNEGRQNSGYAFFE